MMTGKLSQSLRTLPALAPQDVTTVRTGPYLDVSGAQKLLAAGVCGAVANGRKMTIGLMQATNAAGAGAKALGAPVVVTSTADGSTLAPVVEARIGDLDTANNYAFVAVTLVSDNLVPVSAGAILALGNNRFNP